MILCRFSVILNQDLFTVCWYRSLHVEASVCAATFYKHQMYKICSAKKFINSNTSYIFIVFF